MSRQGALAKNTLILSFGSVVPKLVHVVTLPILTGFLSKATFGTYDLVITMASLLLPVATLQLQAAAFRFLIDARDDERKRQAIVTNIIVVSFVLSVAILAIVFAALTVLDVWTRVLICSYYLLDILVVTLRQVARGLSKNTVYAASVILNSIFEGLGIVGLVMLLSAELDGALIASVVGQAISLVYLCFALKVTSLLNFKELSLKFTKELVAYSWPLIPNSLASWAVSLSDRLILTLMIGVEASAVFAAATKIPNMLGIAQSAFTLAWQENASIAHSDEDRDAYYSSMFETIYNLLAGGLGLLIAASPLIFMLLIQGDYDESYIHMNILFAGAFAACISSFLGGIYIAHKKTKAIGGTTVAVAVLNLIIEVVLIPLIGIFAASIAYTGSYIVLAVYRAKKMKDFQPITFDVKNIAATSFILMGMLALSIPRHPVAMAANVFIGAVMFYVLNRDLLKKVMEKVLSKMRRSK